REKLPSQVALSGEGVSEVVAHLYPLCGMYPSNKPEVQRSLYAPYVRAFNYGLPPEPTRESLQFDAFERGKWKSESFYKDLLMAEKAGFVPTLLVGKPDIKLDSEEVSAVFDAARRFRERVGLSWVDNRTKTKMMIRNFRWDDLTGVVGVINRTKGPMDLKAESTEEEIRYILKRYFDAERDCFVVESPAGAIVGIGTMRFLHPPGKGLGVHAIVPEVLEEGVGARLIQATDSRLMERWIGDLPPSTPIHVERDVCDFEKQKIATLEAER
ncbi:unnamed protein product, partial [marine sediment metagenome]